MTALVSKKFERQHQRRLKRQRSRVITVTAIVSSAVIATALFSSSQYVRNNNNNSNFLLGVEAFTTPRPSLPSSSSSLMLTPRIDRHGHYSRAAAGIHLFSSMDEKSVVEGTVTFDGDDDDQVQEEVQAARQTGAIVRAPLKFVGPYPCLGLKFPNLATESQRSRNQTGISLDFVLDTAANINTVQGQVALELQLENLVDSPALPGVSSSGPMAGGETYMLGNSQLEQAILVLGSNDSDNNNNEKDEIEDQTIIANKDNENNNEQQQQQPFEFMQNLTAAVIPVVNPGSAGLLGLAFFYCFEGGVEFRWGSSAASTSTTSTPAQQQQQQQQQDSEEPKLVDGMIVQQQPPQLQDEMPLITFYGDDDADADDDNSELKRTMSELTRVQITPIPLTQLPSVKIKINGVEMVALLDTGSPITVLNERAAHAAGIQTTNKDGYYSSSLSKKTTTKDNNNNGWKNPFSSVVDKFKEAQATAEAASKGEILMIGGIDGKPTTLYRSIDADTTISLVGSSSDGDDVSVSFGGETNSNNNKVYVGDIPGLAALNGIGVDSPPAVVLGLDVLRKRPRMLFRPRDNEVYF